MAYSPELSNYASAALRRIAWALNMPMTRAIEQVIKDSVRAMDKRKVCSECRDRSTCDSCAFYDPRYRIPGITINDMVDRPGKTNGKPNYDIVYEGAQVRVCLVREGNERHSRIKISSPEDVYNLVQKRACSSDREVFLSILLSANNRLIGVETVAIGTLDSCLVTPRELFKSAILGNACSVIVCHYHPSGSLTLSAYDKKLSQKLVDAGCLIGIPVADHVVVSHEGYVSHRELDTELFNERRCA